MTIELVAQRHGITPTQISAWRRRYPAPITVADDIADPVVSAALYHALQQQAYQLLCLLAQTVVEKRSHPPRPLPANGAAPVIDITNLGRRR